MTTKQIQKLIDEKVKSIERLYKDVKVPNDKAREIAKMHKDFEQKATLEVLKIQLKYMEVEELFLINIKNGKI
jgi:hypothetical protein